MEHSVQKSVIITLSMSDAEARWLKALVQNPIGDEDQENASRRQTFFNILTYALSDAQDS